MSPCVYLLPVSPIAIRTGPRSLRGPFGYQLPASCPCPGSFPHRLGLNPQWVVARPAVAADATATPFQDGGMTNSGAMTVLLVRPARLFPGAPYAYAARAHQSDLIFTAGACPLDEQGQVIAPADVRAQMRQAHRRPASGRPAGPGPGAVCGQHRLALLFRREPAGPPEGFPHQDLLVVDGLERAGGAPHCLQRPGARCGLVCCHRNHHVADRFGCGHHRASR
jgi:hypothetical protein